MDTNMNMYYILHDRLTNETALIKRFFDITIPKNLRALLVGEEVALALVCS